MAGTGDDTRRRRLLTLAVLALVAALLARAMLRRAAPGSLAGEIRRAASASRMVSNSVSRREGMKDSTIMSVSESRKMSLINCSAPPRPVRLSPCAPTKWPCAPTKWP